MSGCSLRRAYDSAQAAGWGTKRIYNASPSAARIDR